MLNLLLAAAFAAAPVVDEPRWAPIISVQPFDTGSVLCTHLDGRQSLAAVADILAGQVVFSLWKVDDTAATPTTLRLTYESAVGTHTIETDCRTISPQRCDELHADAITRSQARYPRIRPG